MTFTGIANHKPEYVEKLNKWRVWHKDNPHVWEMFCKLADKVRATGAKKTGAWLIIGRMRWDHFFETEGAEFKLPNDHIAFYARAYMASKPERSGLFKIKRMFGEDFEHTARKCRLDG